MIEGPACEICGRPLESEAERVCYDCARIRHVFLRAKAPFVYSGAIRDSIHRLKYGHRAEYAAFYARAAVECSRGMLERFDPQAVLPVPAHRSRRIKRGYDQAACIAEEVAKFLKIPLADDVIRRKKRTRPQSRLDARERRRNLAGAFVARAGAVLPPRVLIVDDIYTTGSTVDALSALAMTIGAASVCVLTASISVEKPFALSGKYGKLS